jgi:branched-chain amino acid transport system permease protein
VGPVVGATILAVVPEMFRFLQEYRMFVYGGILVAVMLIRPTGLFGGHNYSFRLRIFDKKEKTYERGDKFLATPEDAINDVQAEKEGTSS